MDWYEGLRVPLKMWEWNEEAGTGGKVWLPAAMRVMRRRGEGEGTLDSTVGRRCLLGNSSTGASEPVMCRWCELEASPYTVRLSRCLLRPLVSALSSRLRSPHAPYRRRKYSCPRSKRWPHGSTLGMLPLPLPLICNSVCTRNGSCRSSAMRVLILLLMNTTSTQGF